MGVKLFKFLIVTFLFLNFTTLIFGYIIFLDFSNSQNGYYSNQIYLYSQKENLILNDINSIKNSYDNSTSNIIDLKARIKILKTEASGVSNLSNLKSSNIPVLNSKLSLLSSQQNTLSLERDSLMGQYQQKLARQQARTRTSTYAS